MTNIVTDKKKILKIMILTMGSKDLLMCVKKSSVLYKKNGGGTWQTDAKTEALSTQLMPVTELTSFLNIIFNIAHQYSIEK